jgi:adenylate cyclase class 2
MGSACPPDAIPATLFVPPELPHSALDSTGAHEATVPLKFEIEIKLRLPEKLGKIRHSLHEAGFRIAKPRLHESNTLFDNSKRTMRNHGKLLRLRRAGVHRSLTYKGPSEPSRYKKRHEIEIDLHNGEELEEIFTHLGYRPVFRYEKYRTEYAEPRGEGKVMLDETPIGNYLEIEGSPRWIDRTARELGFQSSDYITRSYGYLYLAFCRERRITPKDMLFGESNGKRPRKK